MAMRPLSPHLQIYRPQITSVLSILHRLTGLLLSLCMALLVLWLAAAAAGPQCFAAVQAVIGSWPVQTLLIGVTLALFYHLFNGVRHLVWDSGRGFGHKAVTLSGWTVVAASVLATAAVWGLS